MSCDRKVAAGGAGIAIPPTALELSKKQMEGPMRNQVLAFHFTSCRSSLRLHRMFSGRFEVSVGRFGLLPPLRWLECSAGTGLPPHRLKRPSPEA